MFNRCLMVAIWSLCLHNMLIHLLLRPLANHTHIGNFEMWSKSRRKIKIHKKPNAGRNSGREKRNGESATFERINHQFLSIWLLGLGLLTIIIIVIIIIIIIIIISQCSHTAIRIVQMLGDSPKESSFEVTNFLQEFIIATSCKHLLLKLLLLENSNYCY